MTQVVAADGREIALELHRLLKELDPARWRADLQQRARARVATIAELLRESRPAHAVEDRLAHLHARFAELARFIEAHLPEGHLDQGDARAAWQSFRAQLTPLYERIAHGLRQHAIHVPELRPTNYVRNVFHAMSTVVALGLLHFFSTTTIQWIAVGFVCWAWSAEYLRRRHPRINEILMGAFGPMAHPHETHRVNSATWFATALVVLAFLDSMVLAGLGLVVLGFAIPPAALVGRKFGSIKLVHGRSLQGSLAFLAVGTACGVILLTAVHGFAPGTALLVALGAAAPATVVELFSRSIDDNLSIPLSAAAGAWLALAALGMAA